MLVFLLLQLRCPGPEPAEIVGTPRSNRLGLLAPRQPHCLPSAGLTDVSRRLRQDHDVISLPVPLPSPARNQPRCSTDLQLRVARAAPLPVARLAPPPPHPFMPGAHGKPLQRTASCSDWISDRAVSGAAETSSRRCPRHSTPSAASRPSRPSCGRASRCEEPARCARAGAAGPPRPADASLAPPRALQVALRGGLRGVFVHFHQGRL